MWWVQKDIFKDEKLAIFVCAGCKEVVMTAEGMLFSEVTSAWNRWKQKHRICKSKAEQTTGL